MKRKIWQYLNIPVIIGIITIPIILTGCKKDNKTENSKDKVPVVNTILSTAITGSGAISGGNVTSDGGSAVTARGVCWSTSQKPTTSNSKTSDGTGTGIFASTITGLSPGTIYYIRAYAINSNGTSYGNQEITTTLGPPTVTTAAVTNVTSTTAVSGGNVTSDGGAALTARGVCWGTSPNPSVSDNKTTEGTEIGSFSSNLNLYEGTTYHIRAYATNNVGTAYGADLTFTTNYKPYELSYYPIAVWLQDPVKNGVTYKGIGINTFVGLWNELDQPQLTAIKSAGLKVICPQNSFGLTLPNETAIVGWNLGDEPDNAQWNATTQTYDPCIDPAIIIGQYNSLKLNDPSRPVFLNLGQGVAYNSYIGRGTCSNNLDTYKVSANGYLVGCDYASFDIYPVNNSDGVTKGKLEYVALGVQNLIEWSGNKPSWCWIECTKISDTSPRKPKTSEVKSEVWMGLIHGAKGFGYFCHSFVTGATAEAALLQDADMTSAVKAINAQITSLAAVLNSETTTGYATVSSDNSSVPVDMMTKTYGGANYIFAIAMRNNQTNATFTITSGNNVEVLGEGRSVTVTNGKFTDTFLPYSVHLYKITTNP